MVLGYKESKYDVILTSQRKYKTLRQGQGHLSIGQMGRFANLVNKWHTFF